MLAPWQLLKRIEDGFLAPFERGPRIVVLYGTGGQGKTKITLQGCRRAKAYGTEAIFWVTAESAEEAKNSFKSIAEAIRDMDEHVPIDVTAITLTRYRNWPRSWLMVIDNFESSEEFKDFGNLIPTATNGHILITSRDVPSKSLASNSTVIQVPGLSEKEAIRLLLRNSEHPPTEKDLEHANHIVKSLDCHPLAIAIANSHVQMKKVSLDQFLASYEAWKGTRYNVSATTRATR